MQRDWVPVTVQIGKLPETVTEEPVVLSLDNAVPNGAEEVLIYTYITSKGEPDDEFHRYYYTIYTSQDGKDYSQYMNIVTGPDMNVINSANLWFPIKTSDRKLRVILVDAEKKKDAKTESKPELKHIAGKLQEREDWSDVFVIGYR